MVSQLISNNGYSRDTKKLNALFDEQSVSVIQKIPLAPTATRDEWLWTMSPSGSISIKTTYSPPNQSKERGWIWKTKIHERYKMLLWSIAADFLPTKGRISRCIEVLDNSCPKCNVEMESTIHLITTCHLSRALWYGSQWGIKIDECNVQSPEQFISLLLNPPQNVSNIEELVLFGAILSEKIWQARNMKVFEGVEPCFESIKSMLARTMSEHSSTISLPRVQQKPRRSIS